MQPKCPTTPVNFSPAPDRRRQLTRTISAGMGCSILLFFAIVGCQGPEAVVADAKPFAGVKLRIAVPDNATMRALVERHGRVWAANSGGTIEIAPADEAADVRLFAAPDAGREIGRLAPVDLSSLKGQEAFQFSRFLRYEVDHNMDWGGRLQMLPVLGESLLCVYRSDLLDNPRHTAALTERFKKRFHHPLRPGGAATWQEVSEIAAYFAAEPAWADGEKTATPRPSLVPLPASAEEFDRDFHAVAASFVRRKVTQEGAVFLQENQKTQLFFTYQLDANSGLPAITSPGFVAALKLQQELANFRPRGTAERPLEAFRAGQAVVALATLADLAWLQDPASPVHDRIGVWRVPASDTAIDPATNNIAPVADSEGNFVPYHGYAGCLGGVDISSTRLAAALDFLVFMSSPPVSLEVVCEPAWGGGPTRDSHLMDNRAGWHNYGLSARHTSELIDAVSGYSHAALNPAYRLRIANQRAYLDVFAEKVRPALVERKPAEAALKDAADAWTGLVKDRDALLREYRMSLGLR
jgi:hypothetical protein